MSKVNEILDERAKTHGDFADVAGTAQSLKQTIAAGSSYSKLSLVQREALDMNASKIARIVEGDPNHVDSWQDISGYAELVVRELEGK